MGKPLQAKDKDVGRKWIPLSHITWRLQLSVSSPFQRSCMLLVEMHRMLSPTDEPWHMKGLSNEIPAQSPSPFVLYGGSSWLLFEEDITETNKSEVLESFSNIRGDKSLIDLLHTPCTKPKFFKFKTNWIADGCPLLLEEYCLESIWSWCILNFVPAQMPRQTLQLVVG